MRTLWSRGFVALVLAGVMTSATTGIAVPVASDGPRSRAALDAPSHSQVLAVEQDTKPLSAKFIEPLIEGEADEQVAEIPALESESGPAEDLKLIQTVQPDLSQAADGGETPLSEDFMEDSGWVLVSDPVPASEDASSTGVPEGTPLTRYNGNLTITTPNTVISGLDIYGFVFVRASGVVIENSRVRGGPTTYDRALISIDENLSGIVIRDCELAPDSPNYHIRGIFARNVTMDRLDIHDVIDQVLILGSNVTIRDSWFHDNLLLESDPNYGNTPSHSDNIQISIGDNLVFQNNIMTDSNTAAIMVTQDRGHVSNMVVSNNRIDNGACSVNLAEKSYGPMHGFVFSGNTFGRNTAIPNCAIIAPTTTRDLMVLSENYYTPDGAVVTVKRGA